MAIRPTSGAFGSTQAPQASTASLSPYGVVNPESYYGRKSPIKGPRKDLEYVDGFPYLKNSPAWVAAKQKSTKAASRESGANAAERAKGFFESFGGGGMTGSFGMGGGGGMSGGGGYDGGAGGP